MRPDVHGCGLENHGDKPPRKTYARKARMRPSDEPFIITPSCIAQFKNVLGYIIAKVIRNNDITCVVRI